HVPGSGDQLDRLQVVAGEPVLAHQPAQTPAEGVAGDAGRPYRAAGDGEAVAAAGFVELVPGHATLRGRGALLGIDGDVPHVGEVDQHPAVGDGAAGDVMAARLNRACNPGVFGEGES